MAVRWSRSGGDVPGGLCHATWCVAAAGSCARLPCWGASWERQVRGSGVSGSRGIGVSSSVAGSAWVGVSGLPPGVVLWWLRGRACGSVRCIGGPGWPSRAAGARIVYCGSWCGYRGDLVVTRMRSGLVVWYRSARLAPLAGVRDLWGGGRVWSLADVRQILVRLSVAGVSVFVWSAAREVDLVPFGGVFASARVVVGRFVVVGVGLGVIRVVARRCWTWSLQGGNSGWRHVLRRRCVSGAQIWGWPAWAVA